MSNGKNRIALARFRHIAALLRTDRFISAADLAAKTEVCRKTVQRDIEFLRDQLELPIESSSSPQGGYRLTRPVAICPVCQGAVEVKRTKRKAAR